MLANFLPAFIAVFVVVDMVSTLLLFIFSRADARPGKTGYQGVVQGDQSVPGGGCGDDGPAGCAAVAGPAQLTGDGRKGGGVVAGTGGCRRVDRRKGDAWKAGRRKRTFCGNACR